MPTSVSAVPCITAQQFTNYLDTQLPVYSKEILKDVTPTDMMAAHISQGEWDAFAGVQQTQDRFKNVQPDTTAAWEDVTEEACAGAPCDPPMNEIGFGYDRLVYGQQRQSWRSQLFCFDQMISATKAVEHVAQIVGDVLRPASARITSDYTRRKNLDLAGQKVLADASLTDFTFTWELTGNQEIYMTPSAFPTSKLTPQMLQRFVSPLRNIGYFGKWTNDPFWGGYSSLIELITDDNTAWDLSKIATDTRISDAWRFMQWEAAHEYYRYGMGGQLGNYMVHVDPFPLRFNKVHHNGTWKLQRVLPYINSAATSGLGRVNNPDWELAQYQISFIHHRFSWRMLTQRMQSINPLMPFLVRDLGGQWQFATNDLGSDCDGNAIANFRKNKGFFYADWRLGAKPEHTEWEVAILHKREPAVIYTVDTCAADPGYPAQIYNSSNDTCETEYVFDDDVISLTGTQSMSASLTNTDATVTVADTSTLIAGISVTGTGIPANTTIASITNGTTFELSQAATATATSTLTFGQYYRIAADSTTCGSEPLDNALVTATGISALATALNNDTALGALGTWSAANNGLVLTGATCYPVLAFVTY